MDLAPEPAEFERNLVQRPGFLIRRLHQIHVALFAEECAGFDVTAVQYSIMAMIALRPGVDQSQISEETGVDRATLANVVARLEAAGLLKRITSRLDRRQKLLAVTPSGHSLLSRMQEPVQRAHSRTVAALSQDQRSTFMHLLATLVEAGSAHGRAKLRLK